MTAPDRDAAVLAYYTREAAGETETQALAGLRLAEFQGARDRLVRRGALIRNTHGRWVPVTA